jgi:hypothetical protein
MEDVTRKRILRMLERLPEEQLYQVLDYMEFLETKYARDAARKPDAFQQFAERVEDQMRLRSVAPKAMRGTMRAMSTAGRFLDGVRELGRDLVNPPQRDRPNGRGEPGGSGETRPTVGSGEGKSEETGE